MRFCHITVKSPFFAVVAFVAVACLGTHVRADIPPRSLSELQESELIVVGTIRRIRIETERSRIERRLGNFDWGVYVTLAVEGIEKGQLSDSEIEFRCFRIKSRRSAMEYLTLSGHRPIPDTGTRVRVYLNRENAEWAATLPNGITPPDANDDESVWPDGRLAEASEVSDLRSLAYTYILPLELWGVLVVVVVPVAILATVFLRRRKRRKARALL